MVAGPDWGVGLGRLPSQVLIQLGAEHALGQRLLDVVEQALRAEHLLRIGVLQQLINQFLLDCHTIPPSGEYGSDTRNSGHSYASQLGADAAKPEHLVTESGIGYRFVP